jgi:hypothetical protein
MPRPMHKLSQVQIGRALKRPCTLNDGGGLYFVSRPPNGASWMFRFSRHGKDRWMGIGQYPTVTLGDARARATDARRLLIDDVDPIENRRQQRAQTKLQLVRQMTFAQCAALYITSHKPAWRNSKHIAQWDATLKTYAHPLIGSLPVAAVDTSLVMKVLQPIWNTKPETASRLRGRIEAILNWATVSEFRTGLNPARWRGHLDNLLPARSTRVSVQQHRGLVSKQHHKLVRKMLPKPPARKRGRPKEAFGKDAYDGNYKLYRDWICESTVHPSLTKVQFALKRLGITNDQYKNDNRAHARVDALLQALKPARTKSLDEDQRRAIDTIFPLLITYSQQLARKWREAKECSPTLSQEDFLQEFLGWVKHFGVRTKSELHPIEAEMIDEYVQKINEGEKLLASSERG